MTEFQLSLTGIHARNEATIQATQDWERRRIDASALRTAFRDDCRSLVSLQEEAGVDYISDGQLTTEWQDFFTPLTGRLEGLAKGPLVRWFNTNTFYYAPVIKGELATDGKAIWRTIEKTLVARGRRLKVMIPDPLTFSELAEDRFYGSWEKVLFAYSDVLHEEIRQLEKQGTAYVQLSSPSLVARFRDGSLPADKLKQQGEAIRSALRGVSLRTCLHTYFGDASPYLPGLLDEIPTDDLGFDFTQTDAAALSTTKKGIVAGVADSRSTYLEGVDELSARVRKVVEKTGSGSVVLAPSSDLRFIPRVSADEKLRRLGALKVALRGGK